MESTTIKLIEKRAMDFADEQGSKQLAASLIKMPLTSYGKVCRGVEVSENTYKKLAKYFGISVDWQNVETTDFKILSLLLKDAQLHSNCIAVTGSAGSGKSIATKSYALSHEEAFKITCNGYWNKNVFLSKILEEIGGRRHGLTVSEMMQEIVRKLKQKNNPILILDEADKLADAIMYFFITLFNELEDHCGLVMIATSYLEKRIKRGLLLNKKGYQEIYSRIGRKFIELRGVSSTDVFQICTANGIKDKAAIKEVWEDCELDLRRVRRKIHAIKQKSK